MCRIILRMAIIVVGDKMWLVKRLRSAVMIMLLLTKIIVFYPTQAKDCVKVR